MPQGRPIDSSALRRKVSDALSTMYAREVPLYGELMEVVRRLNQETLAGRGEPAVAAAEVERISAERHGAIRLGRDDEMATMARYFSVLGMRPVGAYDLSAAGAKAQPVIATAFRPVDLDAIEVSPFRVFCSLLRHDDERFFDDEALRARMQAALERRSIFAPRLLELIERAEGEGGLHEDEAKDFVRETLLLFGWRGEAHDRDLYDTLRARGSNIAADICCFPNPHLNHLTPNTLDIDGLHEHMERVLATDLRHLQAEMKDHIEGPPRREVPILLRQTSYKALVEAVRFDGVQTGTHTARFGEIEQRGLALTPEGRRRYDEALAEVESRRASGEPPTAAELDRIFAALPDDLEALRREGLGYFVYEVTEPGRSATPDDPKPSLDALVETGKVTARPIRYEDFLPVSAAGIFASNLRQSGARRPGSSPHSPQTLESILGRSILDPYATYETQQTASLCSVRKTLGVEGLASS